MLEGVVASDWTASTLLMNMITSWTLSNIKTYAKLLTYDGAQLILAYTGSRVPVPWALTRFLNKSHIFAYSSHMMTNFTYMETYSSPLSSYVHSILLCYLPLIMCQTCVALLMRALTNLVVSSSHQPASHSPTHCRRHDNASFWSLATI